MRREKSKTKCPLIQLLYTTKDVVRFRYSRFGPLDFQLRGSRAEGDSARALAGSWRKRHSETIAFEEVKKEILRI